MPELRVINLVNRNLEDEDQSEVYARGKTKE
jgi:hypothetical protein